MQRFHTLPLINKENVAAHTFGVLTLVNLFSNEKPSIELVKATLYHDVAECYVGDIPAFSKLHLGGVYETEHAFNVEFGLVERISDEEHRLLKCADIADLILFCVEEFTMGNKGIQPVLDNGVRILFENNFQHKLKDDILSYVETVCYNRNYPDPLQKFINKRWKSGSK